MTGVVEGVSTRYEKFSVLVDGVWYSTKQEWAPSPAPSKGDTISFDNKGAKFLNNCKIVTGGGGGGTASAPASGPAARSGFRQAGTEGGFPLHPMAYERALDRRNALTAAVQVAVAGGDPSLLDEQYIINLARKFEDYTTGSLDAPIAKEMTDGKAGTWE